VETRSPEDVAAEEASLAALMASQSDSLADVMVRRIMETVPAYTTGLVEPGALRRSCLDMIHHILEPISRGDIVVFRYPRDPSKSYIKRVIGAEGDRIRIDGGQVYVNGEALDEDYVPPAYADSRSYPEAVVPPHCYFVLGDHRSMSNDSRDFGPVNQSYIYGKAVFGYWPMDKLGRVR